MTEKPILFSGPLVRAILEGRKTVTRRLLNPQPKPGFKPWQDESTGQWMQSGHGDAGDDALNVRFAFGDRLWVREAWRSAAPLDDFSPSVIGEETMEIAPVRYEADGEAVNWLEWRGHDAGRLRAGMHMPRWASRITLEVTGVKVERLQDISDADAKAEGASRRDGYKPGTSSDSIGAFAALWDSINGEREGASWADNPWVAAISFRRAQG